MESLRKREIEMTQGQVMAQKVVIGKSLPDLKPIEYCGNDEKPVQRHMIVEFVQAKRSGSATVTSCGSTPGSDMPGSSG